ncbi:MAG: sulfatase-like hydrolase/transferase [Candidatus Hydrogenedentales bacterium]
MDELSAAGRQIVWTLPSSVVDGKTINWNSDSDQWRSADASGDYHGMIFTGSGQAGADVSSIFSDAVPVHAGDIVSFQAEVRTEGAAAKNLALMAQAKIEIQWKTLQPVVYGLADPDQPELADWTYRKSSVVVPAGATEFRLVAMGYGTQAAGTSWYLRDFQFERISLRDYVAEKRDSARQSDIFLLGVDTLSQTPLSCYGNSPVTTPNIDALAAEGRMYTEVTTAAPWTRPSFASIYTSLYPSQHKAEDFHMPLPEQALTLAEALKTRGYFTGAFVCTSTSGVLGSQMGLAQGFDFYFEHPDEARVREAVQAFFTANAPHLRMLRGGGLFIWQHIWEPHSPYVNRHPERVRNDGVQGTVDVTQPMLANINQKAWTFGDEYNAQDVDYIKRVYAWEAAYVDELVGDLRARLQDVGLYEDANIVLCSDHGESFGENGYWQHGNGYEPTVRTPLILRMPGRIEAGTVDTQSLVSNLDIMPTLLELAGAPIPSYFEGDSLLSDKALERDYAFSEDRRHGWLTVRDGEYKLVAKDVTRTTANEQFGQLPEWLIGTEGAEIEYALYDIQNDPLEQTDLSGDPAFQKVLERLTSQLELHCARMGIGAATGEGAVGLNLPEETIRELETLGYLN